MSSMAYLQEATSLHSTSLNFESSDPVRLDALGAYEFDALPFGVIRLNQVGRIIAYNFTEGLHSGFHQKQVIGRNFFQMAPCANTAKFLGRFKEGLARDTLDTQFEYVFTRLCDPNVRIRMMKAPGEDFWLLIKRL